MRLLAVGLLAFSGCAAEPSNDDGAASGEDAIVGGRTTFHEPAVGVTTLDGATGCSATLVRPNVIILAAHCFGEGRTDIAPWEFQVRRSARETYTVPTGRGWVKPRAHEPGTDDLALLHLEEPIPAEWAQPMPLATRWPSYGTHFEMIGFGCTTRDGSGTGQGTKRMIDITYRVGWDVGLRSRSSCPGDSGGALLDADARSLLGVISGWNAIGADIFADVVAHRAELEREIARLAE
jgi:hypothetical protein